MTQQQLAIDFDALPIAPPPGKFNGSDYVPTRDDVRLRGQQLRIWELMRDHRWRTLQQISEATGDPEASISAQLRHLRKPRFGGFTINKEHLGNGLFQYRIAP
jgi:hypothetical protein